MNSEKRLYRSRDDRMISGVCAGLAEYLNIDPTIVRLIFVIALFVGVGSSLLVYIVMVFVVPEEPLDTPATVVDVEVEETEEESAE